MCVCASLCVCVCVCVCYLLCACLCEHVLLCVGGGCVDTHKPDCGCVVVWCVVVSRTVINSFKALVLIQGDRQGHWLRAQ